MKDAQARIRELERHCEALENALLEIRAVLREPRQTLPAVRRRVGQIPMAVPSRDRKDAS
jgi:hypothetical protein